MESVIDIKDTGFNQEEIEDINRCLTTFRNCWDNATRQKFWHQYK